MAAVNHKVYSSGAVWYLAGILHLPDTAALKLGCYFGTLGM
jgi:hypothetical protein